MLQSHHFCVLFNLGTIRIRIFSRKACKLDFSTTKSCFVFYYKYLLHISLATNPSHLQQAIHHSFLTSPKSFFLFNGDQGPRQHHLNCNNASSRLPQWEIARLRVRPRRPALRRAQERAFSLPQCNYISSFPNADFLACRWPSWWSDEFIDKF